MEGAALVLMSAGALLATAILAIVLGRASRATPVVYGTTLVLCLCPGFHKRLLL